MRNNIIKRKSKFSIFDIVLYIFFIILSIFFIYPIWYCFINALSSGNAIRLKLPLLLPADPTLDAFKTVFKGDNIPRFYFNSVFYAVVGTVISLTLTAMMAYPFIIKEFKGKKVLNIFLTITMFFSGGLLPYYFLINSIGWRNSVLVMLLPGAVSAFNVIVFRTFFKSVPSSLLDSAYIDGAGHYRTLLQIMVPVSKPLFATFALFGMVSKWNDWFTPYLFFTKDELQPIQIYLKETLASATVAMSDRYSVLRYQTTNLNVIEMNLKCAIVIITITPIMCVYPFLQKYFTSGLMIGSIKA